jgi:hypothetical protein
MVQGRAESAEVPDRGDAMAKASPSRSWWAVTMELCLG